MGLFGKRQPVSSVPEESTVDRVRLKREALGKLRRAEALKRRSSAIAETLNANAETNHYIERLRDAWGVTR